mgnify:CR=1 FL=1
MQPRPVTLKEIGKVINKIYQHNISPEEFLLPIIGSKKAPLKRLKKLFDGTSFLLKTVELKEIENHWHFLVVKGKKQGLES